MRLISRDMEGNTLSRKTACQGQGHMRNSTPRDLPHTIRKASTAMSLKCINPEGISTPETFTHVITVKGTRMVFIAGQVAEDNGSLVGPGDMVAQSRQVFANIGRCLKAAGARPDQVTKLTIFVANYKRDYLPEIEEGRVALFGDHKPTDTLVGVAALSHPDFMLEVDAIAIVGEDE
jgi:enamine deaminase RidA (YjgF/YER057c/UK114 family)